MTPTETFLPKFCFYFFCFDLFCQSLGQLYVFSFSRAFDHLEPFFLDSQSFFILCFGNEFQSFFFMCLGNEFQSFFILCFRNEFQISASRTIFCWILNDRTGIRLYLLFFYWFWTKTGFCLLPNQSENIQSDFNLIQHDWKKFFCANNVHKSISKSRNK